VAHSSPVGGSHRQMSTPQTQRFVDRKNHYAI
jgi:hypothetical protein